jgi:methylase of polypeptide subunit release factors
VLQATSSPSSEPGDWSGDHKMRAAQIGAFRAVQYLLRNSPERGRESAQERLLGPIDGSAYFDRWLGRGRAIELFIADDAYPPNPDPSEDWVQFSLRAFKAIAQGRRDRALSRGIGTYLSMGCGAGFDAVAAARILQPRRILLTDLRQDVVSVARQNVIRNSDIPTDEVETGVGNLFAAVPENLKCDLIFENLPVIPDEPGKSIDGRLTGTYFHQDPDSAVPAPYADWTLTSHYLFLREAGRYLSDFGQLVCSIGARMPWEIVRRMFAEFGYAPELVIYDMKEQEELAEVASGLAKIERVRDIKFRFFDLDEGREALRAIRRDPEDLRGDGLRGFAVSRVQADERLDKISMSAQQALEYSGRVGHMVYIVRSGHP